jgi:uncharacterized Zn-finger protein
MPRGVKRVRDAGAIECAWSVAMMCGCEACVERACVVCGAGDGDGALAGAGDDVAGVKRYGCRYCEYRADYPSAITAHERVHSGEKPYGCRYCEYRAATASNVGVHERSHSGEKPYGCRHCEYRAAQPSNITAHERVHSGEKPYGCRYCEYRAAQPSNITVHERVHSGEKPYGCRYCEYRAAQPSHITAHERQRRARPARSPPIHTIEIRSNMHSCTSPTRTMTVG